MRKRLITLGTFDGLHRGHQKLVHWMLRLARRLGLEPMVALFAAPPRFYFHPHARVPLLTSPSQRRKILGRLGVRNVRVLHFDRALAGTPHAKFFEEILVKKWRAGGLLVGRDFAFGKGRKGNLDYLGEACRKRGIRLGVLPLVRGREGKISSSSIRELLLAGKVERASALLGRPHELEGSVIRGRGLGRRLGFPTANLRIPAGIVIPRGVFLVRVSGPFPRPKPAVCNVGTRPTLSPKGGLGVEVHIPGYSGKLYGRTLKVEFLKKIRKERRFPSLEALKRQILLDIRKALCVLLAALGACFAAAGSARAEVRWIKSLSEARSMSAKTGAPILAELSAVWCYSCYYMERRVLSRASFAQASGRFVLLRMDADEEEGRAFREKYAVRFLPSFLVIDSSGAEIGRIVGEQKEEDFLAALGRLAGPRAPEEDRLRLLLDAGNLPEALRHRDAAISAHPELSRQEAWRILSAKLDLAKAVQRKEPEDVLRSLDLLLDMEHGCALAYDIMSSEEIVAAAERAKREDSWRRQRGALETLLNDQVFGAAQARCADLRSAIEALLDVYGNLGLESEKRSLVARAIALFQAESARLGIGQDRNIDDNLRYFLERGGREADIDELYDRLIPAYPSDYVYAYRYAKYLRGRKRTAEALSWANKAELLSYGANRLDVARLRAEILLQIGRRDEARGVLEREIKANRSRFPKEAEALAKLLRDF